MPLEYAALLKLRSGDQPAPLERVAAIAAAWAGIDRQSALEGGRFSARDGASAQCLRISPTRGDDCAWMLRYSKPDESDGVVWVVEVAGAEVQSATEVSVTLRRESADQRLRPLATRPAPPRIVRDLILADDVTAVDGSVALTLGPRRLENASIPTFVADFLMNPDRNLPVVCVSENGDGRTQIDPDRVSRDLAGLAHICVVSDPLSWGLSEQFSDRRLAVHSGGVRLWWPGLEPDSSPFDHPLWLPVIPPARVATELVRTIWGVGVTRYRPIREVVRIQRAVAGERSRRQEELIADLRGRVRDATTTNGQNDNATGEMQELEDLVRMVEDENAQLRNRSEELEDLLGVAQDQNAQLRAKAFALQYALDTRAHDEGTGSMDPAGTLLREIEQSYESFTSPGDRDDYPLAHIVVGPRFLEALEQLVAGGGIERSKIVRISAEVACGRAHKIVAREVHQLREGDGGNTPSRTRSRDGATAWRCSLQVKTPQARRLHWWALSGGGVELAWAGLHDDLTCPE